MTKTYCIACAYYISYYCTKKNGEWKSHQLKRECTHPKGSGKLENPRTPETCPLEIKYRLTPENSVVLLPQNSLFMPLVNPSMGSFDWLTEKEMEAYKKYRSDRVQMND